MGSEGIARRGSDAWVTSRWTRAYDWDWTTAKPTSMTEHSARLRADILPPSFYYHVLRVVQEQPSSELDVGTLRVQCVEATDTVRSILSACHSPRSIASIIAEVHGAAAGTKGAVLGVTQALIRAGLLAPAGAEEPPDTAAAFHAARTLYGFFQQEEEMVPAMEAIHAHAPKTVVEIGTAWGGSLFCWAQVADPDALLVSVDLPGGVGGAGYLPESIPHFRNFCFEGQELVAILGDSRDSAVIGAVDDALAGRSIDLLFIDGDHAYEGVKADFEQYSPLVTPGGMVMFHDIQPQTEVDPAQRIEVSVFWDEISAGRRSHSFIADPSQSGAGIGIIYMD
ncbi:class I SAM-dependent methyltransferase [Candidatus Poribacteria bacterium]|nr:class I SAM-dependent methyltransferase [Candidatus Poribacteria bacterium]MBT5533748.1 class I SAM-dependent methyltransferase [Candidatus Poribacteria bacterium]MBT5712217.1 class I SAM-dependent methyltransferase [Candidatus Poribacteria bacterium]MBT7803835.1 class I SAM-dependent methyltransferase [Candidatus Poribacteria bacterium]